MILFPPAQRKSPLTTPGSVKEEAVASGCSAAESICSWNATETAAGRCNKTEAEGTGSVQTTPALQTCQSQSQGTCQSNPQGTCLALSVRCIVDIVTDRVFLNCCHCVCVCWYSWFWGPVFAGCHSYEAAPS